MISDPKKPSYLSGLAFDEFVEVLDELEKDGPRGAVLIGHALLENLMMRVLQSRMIDLSKDEQDRLFGGIGPLASMGSRVRIAYAFGIIGKPARDSLNRLRELRNLFAHSGHKIGFDHPRVVEICRSLIPDEKDTEPRRVFISALKALIVHLTDTISPDATP
jgi:DNA-binding MltR family transcriptional regulator